MVQLDIFRIIFEQILRIDPSLLYKYSTIQDQLLYLVFIPHVILILFIYAFSIATVARVIGPHKGLRYLVSIVAYIYIVWSGWYGTLLVPLLLGWFWIALVLGLFIFFVSMIISPARAAAGVKLAGEAGKMLAKKPAERKTLENEIEDLQREEVLLTQELAATAPGMSRDYVNMRLTEVRRELVKKRSQLARL